MTPPRPQILIADITTLKVDAIVNAANSALAGGGGVDGAIHRAAGVQDLQQACQKLGGCNTGDAKSTPGFQLPAKWIIHTVGPVWKGGTANEDALLESCYRKSLKIAHDLSAHSIAFPAISTGVYGFPADRAAKIAIQACKNWLDHSHDPISITLCCFGEDSANHHTTALKLAYPE